VLQTRRKIQELISGPFGVVFADLQYEYTSRYGSTPSISFQVRPDSKAMERESPRVISELPPAASQLMGISVIRAFRSESDDIVAVGTYNSTGELLNVTADVLKLGDLEFDGGIRWFVRGSLKDYMQKFGFPAKVSAAAYRHRPWPAGCQQSV
jgi:hypothetical protein